MGVAVGPGIHKSLHTTASDYTLCFFIVRVRNKLASSLYRCKGEMLTQFNSPLGLFLQ